MCLYVSKNTNSRVSVKSSISQLI